MSRRTLTLTQNKNITAPHGDPPGLIAPRASASVPASAQHDGAPVSAVPIGLASWRAWPQQLLAGAIGAVVSVAIVLTLGLLALAPLGAQAAEVGVTASFACVVVSGLVFAVLGRSLIPSGGPSSATALIMAGLVAQVVAATPAGDEIGLLVRVSVAMGSAVAWMGLLQMVMAVLRLSRLVRVVPQPVLAGFMNGIALLILLSQLPALMALPLAQWQDQGWRALQAASPGALLLGLGTAAVVWLLARRAPRAPSALIGLLAGVAAYHAGRALWPALELGGTLGNVSAAPTLPGLLTLATHGSTGLQALGAHAGAIALTGALLAIIGTLESMLNLRATDQSQGSRHDEQHELWAMGMANLLGGPLGALPMVQLRARATAILQAGGHGRAAAVAACAVSALIITVGAGWVAALPQAVLAGVMITVALALVDHWSDALWGRWRRGPGRRQVRISLAIMTLVCLLTLWRGPALGVLAGMALSMAAFVQGMNRSVLRARRDGVALPSRRVHPAAAETWLQTARRRILVLELEGALFFGSAERVADEADALPAGCRFLVLDLRRVGAIDDSAARVLQQMRARLAPRGITLLLAGVGPGSVQRAQLEAFFDAGGEARADWFRDTDHAVEAAEHQLLDECAPDTSLPAFGSAVSLAGNSLMQGLSAAQLAAVQARLQTRTLSAGESLFQAGDAADGLYLLSEGSISVLGPGGQRYVSFSPGTMLGELAMLDRQGRSASAVADSAVVVHLLTHEALAALALDEPALCTLLYRNIAAHLATRLRVASEAWSGAAS